MIRFRHALAVAAAFLAGCAAASEPYVLQPGHVDFARGPDGNTVILDAPGGLIVIDTGRHPAHARAILDHARRAGKPVIAIANTHWHLDHTTGNRDVLAEHPGARLVATSAMAGALDGFLRRSRENARAVLADPATPPETRARIERSGAAMDDRAAMVPADPVAADREIELGGRRLVLHVAHAAATEDDLWLTVPDEGLAIVGDLVVAPVPFFDTGCEEGWRAALDAIWAAPWTTLIPGHGASMTREDFARWRGGFDAWLGCAASDSVAADCAEGWMRDAAGFYTAEEEANVRLAAEEYVTAILRAPMDERMDYCRR